MDFCKRIPHVFLPMEELMTRTDSYTRKMYKAGDKRSSLHLET